MKTLIMFVTLIICSINSFSQVVKNDTKIRIGFGMANLSKNDFNIIIDDVEDRSKDLFTESGLSTGRFDSHLFFSMDYETEISRQFSYMFTIEYHNDHAGGSDVDYTEGVSESMNIDLTYLIGGISLIYYYPAFGTAYGDSKIFGGLGVDLVYTNIDIYHYYNEIHKGGIQEIDVSVTGYNIGGKLMAGFELPFMPSTLLQIKIGYSYRKSEDFFSKVTANKNDPFSRALLDRESYNLSGTWGGLGVAYYF